MSLGLHLAALTGGCTMPPIAARSNPQINPHSSNVGLSEDIHSGHLHSDGLHTMKEYSLITHIESLKAVANGNIPYIKSNTNIDGAVDTCAVKPIDTANAKQISASSCHQGFPQIVSLSHITDHLEYAEARPSSSKKWALDPDSVTGNLRTDSAGKHVSLTLEEILSCTSSSMAKGNENGDEGGDGDGEDNDDSAIPKKINLKQRRKSAKSTKRKQIKNKETHKSHSESGFEEKQSGPSNRHALKSNEKKTNSHYSHLASDIVSITALCKGIKIQQKQSNSISIQQAPYARKTSTTTSPQNKTPLSLKASLESAMTECTKKHTVSTSHTNHRRKMNNADEEHSKTTKVYLSEKQSGLISDCGASIPCAPPATPTPDQLKRFEYVPALQDIRSQRSFRQRLQMMETRALKKEKRKQEDCVKIEKMSMREKRIEIKKKQRREIYALNKLMTDVENDRFKQFMLNAGSNL